MTFHRIAFICTIFVSAFLLFLIQPMIAKMVLPQLGGSPSVWQTVMLFFQSLLLLGYVYVCFTSAWLSLRIQKIVHITLTLTALSFLPLALYLHEIVDRVNSPIIWLFITLFGAVGLPFFVLSANAPLLQRWFSFGRDPDANNPYFLYSASNVGSLLALLSYPIIIEPYFPLAGQSFYWSAAYVAFFLLIAGVVWITRTDFQVLTGENVVQQKAIMPPWCRQIYWGFLSFIPSSLMLGVTNYITTDVASFPLLWILPLAIYLVSFIFVFASKMPFYDLCCRFFPVAVAMPLLFHHLDVGDSFFQSFFVMVFLYLLSFFVICMVAHGKLSLARPEASGLTYFYMWMSIGGALGGLFNAVIAPRIFSDVIEYNIVLLLSALVIGVFGNNLRKKNELIQNILLFAMIIALMVWGVNVLEYNESLFILSLLILSIIYFKTSLFPWRICAVALALICVPVVNTGYKYFFTSEFTDADTQDDFVPFKKRNFFGISQVIYNQDVEAYEYSHGTTLHGGQSVYDEYELMPGFYYQHFVDEFKDNLDPKYHQYPFAITGLGVGTLACFGSEGQEADIYEIDPVVVQIAQDVQYFTFLSECPGQKKIILGDARLKLEEAEDQKYGIMFMDAYSSDALPVHLLTEEAFALYLKKLRPDGILAFNISNRHLDLRPVLASFAKKYGMVAFHRVYSETDDDYAERLVVSSDWIVITKDRENLPSDEFLDENDWYPLQVDKMVHWTDNFSSIFSILY